MKIVSENSENLCIREIEALEKNAFGHRAMLIKLSALQNKKLGILRLASEAVNKLFGEQRSSLYIFSDYDMMITYQGATIMLIDSVYEKLSEVCGEDVSRIIQVFDLEKNAIIAKSICNKKIELIELEKKAAQRSVDEASKEVYKSRSPINVELDSTLMATMAERKSKNIKTKILLIEDDLFSRRLVKNILAKDFDVIEADDGNDALLKYVTHAPNVVFLDINLPDCNGMELLEKFISIDKTTYVVMLSGNAFKDNIVLSIQKGAKGFVGKPFPKEKILHYIEKYKEEKRS